MIRIGAACHPEWLLILPLCSILEEEDDGTTLTLGWLIFSICINIK